MVGLGEEVKEGRFGGFTLLVLGDSMLVFKMPCEGFMVGVCCIWFGLWWLVMVVWFYDGGWGFGFFFNGII